MSFVVRELGNVNGMAMFSVVSRYNPEQEIALVEASMTRPPARARSYAESIARRPFRPKPYRHAIDLRRGEGMLA